MKYNWTNKKILVVDDNAVNKILIRYLFEPTNVQMSFVGNSSEFFEVIKNKEFDLILMDIELGEKINGCDLINYLKVENINTPIIIQTAYDIAEIENLTNEILGYVKEVVNKPLNFNNLYSMIDEIFKN